jgi:hypothetical protein
MNLFTVTLLFLVHQLSLLNLNAYATFKKTELFVGLRREVNDMKAVVDIILTVTWLPDS